MLFVGDITAAKIHAFALREADLTPQTGVELGNFHNFEGRDQVVGLNEKLTALFGTTIDKIVVNDIAFITDIKGFLDGCTLSLNRDISAIEKLTQGKLEVLELDSIPHSQVSIPNEPDSKAMLEFDPQRMYAITDVKYYNGELFVLGSQTALRLDTAPDPLSLQLQLQRVPWRSSIESAAI